MLYFFWEMIKLQCQMTLLSSFFGIWDVVGPTFTNDVCDFFHYDKLLRDVNSMIIILVPKVPHSKSLS